MHRLSNVDYLTVVEKLFRRSERIVVAVVVVERIEQEWMYGLSLHTAIERKFELTNQDSARRPEKLDCPDVDESQGERHWNQVTFLTG